MDIDVLICKNELNRELETFISYIQSFYIQISFESWVAVDMHGFEPGTYIHVYTYIPVLPVYQT